jgi:hypothetical protein
LLAMSLFQTVYLTSGIPHTSSGTYCKCSVVDLTTVVNNYPLPSLPLDSASQRAFSCMSSAGQCYWACCRLAHRALEAFHLFEPASTAFHPSHTLAAQAFHLYSPSSWHSSQSVFALWFGFHLSGDWEGCRVELVIAWLPTRALVFRLHLTPASSMSIR